MLTCARASICAAFRPPRPAPTITTRYADRCAALPFMVPLYKIQRDGNGLQNFRGRLACGVDTVARPVGCRFVFCRHAGHAGAPRASGKAVGRRWHRLAYSHRSIDSGDACGASRRSVFNLEWAPVVCLGVALRRNRRLAGENGRTKRRGRVHGADHCSRILVDIPVAAPAGHKYLGGGYSGAAGGIGLDDSFSGPPACVELAVYGGVVLDSGDFRSRCGPTQPSTTSAAPAGPASPDAAVGELAWLIARR